MYSFYINILSALLLIAVSFQSYSGEVIGTHSSQNIDDFDLIINYDMRYLLILKSHDIKTRTSFKSCNGVTMKSTKGDYVHLTIPNQQHFYEPYAIGYMPYRNGWFVDSFRKCKVNTPNIKVSIINPKFRNNNYLGDEYSNELYTLDTKKNCLSNLVKYVIPTQPPNSNLSLLVLDNRMNVIDQYFGVAKPNLELYFNCHSNDQVTLRMSYFNQ